jgi:hypothetical protein
MKIGQDYRSIAAIVDYISAMAYPSHYAPGTYGIADPNRDPYATVKGSMSKALERSPGVPLEKHRAWLQDFSMGGVHYGPAQVTAQIKALHDLGLHSFLLWDPSNQYNRTLNFSEMKFPPAPKEPPKAEVPKTEPPKTEPPKTDEKSPPTTPTKP